MSKHMRIYMRAYMHTCVRTYMHNDNAFIHTAYLWTCLPDQPIPILPTCVDECVRTNKLKDRITPHVKIIFS